VRASEFLRSGLWVGVSLVVHPELRNTQLTSTFLPKVFRDLDSLVFLNQVCQSRLKRFGEREFWYFQTTAGALGPLLPWKKLSRTWIRLLHENQSISVVKSFHEKAGECQVFSFIFLIFSFFFFASSFSKLFPLSQAASVATLPSALFVERLSLGARWVYLFQ
jgi:hypothetical protein